MKEFLIKSSKLIRKEAYCRIVSRQKCSFYKNSKLLQLLNSFDNRLKYLDKDMKTIQESLLEWGWRKRMEMDVSPIIEGKLRNNIRLLVLRRSTIIKIVTCLQSALRVQTTTRAWFRDFNDLVSKILESQYQPSSRVDLVQTLKSYSATQFQCISVLAEEREK